MSQVWNTSPPNFYQKASLRDFFNHWLIKGIAWSGVLALVVCWTKNLEAWKTGKEKQRCNVGWANGVKKNTFSEQVELKTQLGFVEGPFISSTGFNWVRKNATKLKFIGFVFRWWFCFYGFYPGKPPWRNTIWENMLVAVFFQSSNKQIQDKTLNGGWCINNQSTLNYPVV